MLRLIKADSLRMSKRLYTKVIALLILFNTISYSLSIRYFGANNSLNPSNNSIFYDMFINIMLSVAPYMLIIFVYIFYDGEFKNKTIARAIESSIRKPEIYFAKLINIYLTSIIAIVLTIALNLVLLKLLCHIDLNYENLTSSLKFFGEGFLVMTSYAAFLILIIHLSNTDIVTIVIYILFTMLNQILNLLSKILGLEILRKIAFYTPAQIFYDIKTSFYFQIQNDQVAHIDKLWLRIGISIIIAVIITIINLKVFEEKNI